MDRDKVLHEELEKNATSIAEWQAFKYNQEVTIWNIEEFSKKLSANVLVPIGRKAHMRGTLVHTNELMLAHDNELFSKCTAHKAKEICSLRLNRANHMLMELETERKLFMDKLTKPLEFGALPGPGQVDLRTEYTPEKAKRLVSKSKGAKPKQPVQPKKVQAAPEPFDQTMLDEFRREVLEGNVKDFEGSDISLATLQTILKEEGQILEDIIELPPDFVEGQNGNVDAQLEIENERTVEDYFAHLDKLGFEETKENEMAKIEADTQAPQILRKLMAGEIKPRISKQRVGCKSRGSASKLGSDSKGERVASKTKVVTELEKLENDLEEQPATDENAENGHFKKQRVHKPGHSNAQANTMPLQELNLQDFAMEERNKKQQETVSKPLHEPKKRVSFSLAHETLEFVLSEKVTEMRWRTPKKEDAKVKDAVKRNKFDGLPNDENHCDPLVDDKLLDIQERVNRHYNKMLEHQSEFGADLVQHIIDASAKKPKTLHIPVQHSSQLSTKSTVEVAHGPLTGNDAEENTPGSPADFYDMFLKVKESQTNTETEDPIITLLLGSKEERYAKVPLIKEADRQFCYEDPRREFSRPTKAERKKLAQPQPPVEPKSILRNGSAVNNEPHSIKANKKNKKYTADKKDAMSSMTDLPMKSAYFKTVGEVVERPPIAPDPLPKGKFINAHAPKKRISRFSQMRAEKS